MKEKEPMLQKHGFFFYPLHRNKANPQIKGLLPVKRKQPCIVTSEINPAFYPRNWQPDDRRP